MKKVVLKVDVHDGKCTQKAMKMVSAVPGLELISMDMEEKKLTLIGDLDPIAIVSRIRKVYQIQIITVAPAKEDEIRKVCRPRKLKELVLSLDVRDGTKEPREPNEGPKKPEAHQSIVYMDRGDRQITTINNNSFLCGSCLCGLALMLDWCL